MLVIFYAVWALSVPLSECHKSSFPEQGPGCLYITKGAWLQLMLIRHMLVRRRENIQLGRQCTELSAWSLVSVWPSSSPSSPPVILYPMFINITSRGSAFMRFWFAEAASSELSTSRSSFFPSCHQTASKVLKQELWMGQSLHSID